MRTTPSRQTSAGKGKVGQLSTEQCTKPGRGHSGISPVPLQGHRRQHRPHKSQEIKAKWAESGRAEEKKIMPHSHTQHLDSSVVYYTWESGSPEGGRTLDAGTMQESSLLCQHPGMSVPEVNPGQNQDSQQNREREARWFQPVLCWVQATPGSCPRSNPHLGQVRSH